MKNSRKTKRTLLYSALALILCFTMLLGTTFAWFTDTASTAVNKIQAGTLDIELLDKEGNTLEGKTLSWQKAAGHEDEAVLWEPGASYDLEAVTIKNNGNLALKYKIVITGIDGDAKLNEVIDWTVTVGDETYDADTEFHLTAQSETDLTISGKMQTTAGNEYQGLSIDSVAITVYATQDTVEYDSTTNQYDKDATYDNFGLLWSGAVASDEELAAATDNEAKTLKITTPELLAAFAKSVNDGKSYYGYTVTLENDMNLNNINWTPIGTASHPFMGDFDGNGHTISNLKVNGGVKSPVDTDATGQGFMGCLYASGNMAYIRNLTINNADVYAKNCAGAFVGILDTYQHVAYSGQSNIWNCKLTGKVTVKGGNSGGIAGSPLSHWCMLASIQDITIDVDAGSYVSNVGVTGATGTVGGVTAITVYSSVCQNITTNLDVIANTGNVGGVVGIAGGTWKNIKSTGDVTIKNASEGTDTGTYALAIGSMVTAKYAWGKTRLNVDSDTVSGTGNLTIEFADGTTATSNGQASNAIGKTLW